MSDFQLAQVDPRWGSENRPLKADMIWRILQHFCGCGIAEGVWVDVGCGSGDIAAALAPRVTRILGVDPEPWARWSDLMNEHSNLRYFQSDCEIASGIEPSSADIVICNQVYEHVADPLALIRFIHRILKPGGYCYFAGPNLLFPIEPHVFWPFVHWLPRGPVQGIMRVLGAKYVVEANSVSYWKLMGWFKDFAITNALPYVVRHAVDIGRSGTLWRSLAHMPNKFLEAMTPLSPGFIFILHKPDNLVTNHG